MKQKSLRAAMWSQVLSFVLLPLALAQAAPGHTASAEAQPAAIPFRVDAGSDRSITQSAVLTLVFLAVVAGAGLVSIRYRKRSGPRRSGSWLWPVASSSKLKPLEQTSLTQHASVHVIEWNGEELLLGCTSHSVALLARKSVGDSPSDNSPDISL